jgi:hypothetical protein
MYIIASFITDPKKFFEFPFVIMEQTGTFVVEIMQRSFEFASAIGKLAV